MPRTARLIAPGHPHHVTHRGVDRQRVFFADSDYQDYLSILEQEARRTGTAVWAYCLMPNHVHLVLTPSTATGLGRTIGETSRRFARLSNRRREVKGAVWQSRFYSVALDERHLLEAVRYVLLNPVRANLTGSADFWPWSSFRAHKTGHDSIVVPSPLADRIGAVEAFLATGMTRDTADQIRAATRTGRPLGDKIFSERIARSQGVELPTRGRGRPAFTGRPQ
ncbi:transposase [Bradyrhizobium sp. CCBAU 45384]|uniref:transposase n=1 Tax=Bradyrhizobium sp. CCBAU 45384 TaxID=858428 RepID=UPI003FA43A84|nr:hypothetical protein [Bradyrhizobium sp. CCBAU 45384]